MTVFAITEDKDLDIFVEENGGIAINIYTSETSEVPEDSLYVSLEEIADQFCTDCADDDEPWKIDASCEQIAYNLLDSLRATIKKIEDKLFYEPPNVSYVKNPPH